MSVKNYGDGGEGKLHLVILKNSSDAKRGVNTLSPLS